MPGSAKRKASPTSAPATPPVKASKADPSKDEVVNAAGEVTRRTTVGEMLPDPFVL